MIDVTTKQRLTVSTPDPEYPYVWVPFVQLDEVRQILDQHRLRYTVDGHFISVDGGPEMAVVRFRRGADAKAIQSALDSVE